jgi:putative transposase
MPKGKSDKRRDYLYCSRPGNGFNQLFHHASILWPTASRVECLLSSSAKDTESEDRPRQAIDQQFMDDPRGVVKMAHYLQRLGHAVGEKLVRRLTRSMNLPAIYPKPRLSRKHPEHKIYPYLPRGVESVRANQVWAVDITYVSLRHGFCYLVAIMDWFSRYVLAWRLSNTLDAIFCVECLKDALTYGQPEIFNSDQGVQFTSMAFIQVLLGHRIRISMDGRGRVFDNISIERDKQQLLYFGRSCHTTQDLF